MSEHTPGPWGLCFHLQSKEQDESCPCGYRGSIWSADGEQMICEMGTTPQADGTKMVAEPDRDTRRANARLIAAAPDLLAALRSIRARVAGEYDHPNLIARGPLLTDPVLDVARFADAAIAKAEGRA